MNKSEYLRLLSEASINDSSKFQAVPLERPSSKGRPPTYYHPLLKKEKDLDAIVRRILPKSIADTVRPTGSRLAHLYGLPKTHKERLAMRPILSATQTYNYALAKWLDTKLKPLSLNRYTVTSSQLYRKSCTCNELRSQFHISVTQRRIQRDLRVFNPSYSLEIN